jgi:hypothetical protein
MVSGVPELAENGADEAARLEAALERIAHAAGGSRTAPEAPPRRAAAVDTRVLAARLDALIADLRSVLGQH